ncbi:thiamine phosphate synthase [Lederbergia lenta]|uniref:thiamine phosphate synthase n=1 Tax=Lederbergia lenta TaxID=1467 RepID=UPI00203CCEE4|nr:thiamine phosphate synthase [Lederbergia lenta]MCM3109525.1 thiamine phosphate synthase [Lederbergia lenta]
MRNTYALNLVTEESVPLGKLLPIIEEAVKGGVTIVQLREKRSTGKCFYEKAKSVKALLDRYDIPLIINDRVDIALAVGAAGVHVGQDDLPLVAIRKMLPSSMIVGISTSTMEEAKEAEKNGASYIGVGSVFTTKSKADASLLPKGDLEKIAEAVSIPVVAIGGIGLDNMKLLPINKIAGVAVVSAIMKSENPYDAAIEFRKYLE